MAASNKYLPFIRVITFLLVVEGLLSFLKETVFSLSILPNWSVPVDYFLGAVCRAVCVCAALPLMAALDAASPVSALGLLPRGRSTHGGIHPIQPGQPESGRLLEPLSDRALALGLGIGAAVVLVRILIQWALGSYHIIGLEPHFRLGFVVIDSLVVAVGEEACYRGYVFRVIEPRHGTLTALLTSSLLFGGAHILYHIHDYTLSGAVHRAFLFSIGGLFFGGAYIVSRRLWLLIGIHWSFNIVDTMFFPGSYVSSGAYFRVQVSHDASAWVDIAVEASVSLMLLILAIRKGSWRAPASPTTPTSF